MRDPDTNMSLIENNKHTAHRKEQRERKWYKNREQKGDEGV